MVEVARAFTVTDAPLDLVILDEPTSSLDAHAAGQLLVFVRRFVATGKSCVLISHLLGEILENADRIVVMRDGKVVATDAASTFDRARLVATMGGVEHAEKTAVQPDVAARQTGKLRVRPARCARATAWRSSHMKARLSGWQDWRGTVRPTCCLRSSEPRAAADPASRSPHLSRWLPATARPTASSRNGRLRKTSASARLRGFATGS